MELDFLKELYRHMNWADARVWTVALATDPKDPVLVKGLLHFHATQLAFLRVWKGEEVNWKDFPNPTTLTALLPLVREYHDPATAFMNTLKSADLERDTPLPWASHMEQYLGQAAEPTNLGVTLYQVVSHTTHHRGQMCTRLRELGAEPPMVDYIAWAWLGQPDAAWPE